MHNYLDYISVVLVCDRTSTISHSIFFKAILKFYFFVKAFS